MKKVLVVLVAIAIVSLMSADGLFAFPPGGSEQQQQQATVITGKVVETMDAGPYTYVCVEKGGKKTWVAVPKMKVKKGQNISFKPGMEMINFESKTLKRKFDRIIFSEGPVDNK